MFISPDFNKKTAKGRQGIESGTKNVSGTGRKYGKNKVREDSKKRQWEGCSAVSDSAAHLDTNTNRINSVHALTLSTAHTHTHALKCLLVNARGIISKIDILKTLIHEM